MNLIENVLEVYRDPAGDTYRSKATYTTADAVAPAAKRDSAVSVADLLP